MLCSAGTPAQFVSKFEAKIRSDWASEIKGHQKLAFFDQYLALFRKWYKAIVTMEDQMKLIVDQ